MEAAVEAIVVWEGGGPGSLMEVQWCSHSNSEPTVVGFQWGIYELLNVVLTGTGS